MGGVAAHRPGQAALAFELRRGVEPSVVDQAVSALPAEQEEQTAGLVAAKLASTRTLDPAARTRRLAGMLARKGYPPGLAFRVVRRIGRGRGSLTISCRRRRRAAELDDVSP